MRGEELVKNQMLMAQAIGALADHIDQAIGYQLTPVPVAKLPNPAGAGMISYVSDALSPTIGGAVTGGGTVPALVWYTGAIWKVLAL